MWGDPLSPLHGVPFITKDFVDTAGGSTDDRPAALSVGSDVGKSIRGPAHLPSEHRVAHWPRLRPGEP